MDTVLLTDERGAVSLAMIKAAVRGFVSQRKYSQIIIYFAGHGILAAQKAEMWLLSGAPDDPNEAVDLTSSVDFARDSRIPHVVIISDACRSRSAETRLSQVKGGAIFPNQDVASPRAAVDLFFASLPGNPAIEAPAAEAVNSYRGLYTECLLDGLYGKVHEVIVDQQPKRPRWVVPSFELKEHLFAAVPEKAAEISVKLLHDPDAQVESRLPKFLSELSRPPTPPPPTPGPAPKMLQDLGPDAMRWETHGAAPSISPKKPRVQDLIERNAAMQQLLQAKGRESFETETGFTVVGAGVERAAVTGSRCDKFFEREAVQIRVHAAGGAAGRTMLLQFDSGRGMPLAVLDGMIGTVVVQNGQVATVSYVPSRNSRKYRDYQPEAKAIEQMRAFAAVATLTGEFKIQDSEQGRRIAEMLRALKSFDPTLGLYAAYAYTQAGDIEAVRSVLGYMVREREAVLFDVPLLARSLSPLGLPEGKLVAPFCPMLTQGWSFVRSLEIPLHPAVMESANDLQPGLWTSFSPESMGLLFETFGENVFA